METIFAFAFGVTIGIVMACLCRSGKIATMQQELDAKREQWCAGCEIHKRASDLAAKLDYSYMRNRDLEKRIDQKNRSITELGKTLQKRTLRF